MAGNRSAAEKYILTYISKITNGSKNVDIYREFFKKMSDREFEKYMSDLATGAVYLTIEMPNYGEKDLSVENNLAIGKEIGHEFFQHLWVEGDGNLPTYKTPIPFMLLTLPVRRASQLLTKKISVPKHNRVIDTLTGQPTGESKGAKISYPEAQILSAMGLDYTAIELMKYRGGDAKGRSAMTAMLSRYGKARQESLKPYASGVESTKSFKTFLTACHLKNTL